MSMQTSRRAVLAGLGIAASVAAVSATASPHSNDDAELLRLGRELDAALVDWSAQLKAEQLDGAEFEAECFRATGMTYAAATAAAEQFEASGRGHVADAASELKAYFRTRDELSRARYSDPAESEREIARSAANYDRLGPIVEAIFEIHATTITGLAVKARAAMWYASEFWLTDDDQFDELGRRELKALAHDILAVAGVPGVDGLEPPTLPAGARSA
jgi:hypothetical protein